MSLQLPAQALQLAAGQDGLAVLIPEVVLVLDQLVLLLLQCSHLFLGVAVLLQLTKTDKAQSLSDQSLTDKDASQVFRSHPLLCLYQIHFMSPRVRCDLEGSAHQFSVLLTQASQFFLWGAQSIQRLHENSDFFACIKTGDGVRKDTSDGH